MNKLTPKTECPCGTLAVRFHAGVPCCQRCYEIEAALESERLSRSRRLVWEQKFQSIIEEEIAA